MRLQSGRMGSLVQPTTEYFMRPCRFGAESVDIFTHDGNEPRIRYLYFESPSQVHGLAPLKAAIVAAFSARAQALQSAVF